MAAIRAFARWLSAAAGANVAAHAAIPVEDRPSCRLFGILIFVAFGCVNSAAAGPRDDLAVESATHGALQNSASEVDLARASSVKGDLPEREYNDNRQTVKRKWRK